MFAEYFLTSSALYVLLVTVLIVYNFYGLLIQKAVSECIALILFMCFFLLLNDDVFSFGMLNFTSFTNTIANDSLAFFGKLVICFFSAFYFLIIADFLKQQELTCIEYLLITLFSILGLLIQCCVNDLLSAYLAIELSSLAFYLMASFKKSSLHSIESGIKYFITGAISSAFFLLGTTILYCITGTVNFLDFFVLFDCSHLNLNSFFISQEPIILKSIVFETGLFNATQIALILILFSIFIKLALAPFHLWSLDVYEGSPTNSTFFFAAISKISIFVLLIRFCYFSFLGFEWNNFCSCVGISSIFVGSFGGLKQRKLKTLLAYSSISHMGYMIVSFSASTVISIQMVLFYMLVYMISSMCFWHIILLLQLKMPSSKKYSKEIGDIALLRKSNKALAFSMALTMFAIAGVPPLIGFLAKLNIFLSIVGISFYFVGIFSLICSTVSTFYYIRVVKIVYFENLLIGKLYKPINNVIKPLFLAVFILFFITMFLDPSILYLITYKIVLFRHGITELIFLKIKMNCWGV